MMAMLDTCVVIDFERYEAELPDEVGVSVVVFAEMQSGVTTLPMGPTRAARLEHLRWARTFFDPVPFTLNEATAYGRMVAAVRRAGRSERPRVADLLIAATAAVQSVPLYTNNKDDFFGLDQLVEVIAL